MSEKRQLARKALRRMQSGEPFVVGDIKGIAPFLCTRRLGRLMRRWASEGLVECLGLAKAGRRLWKWRT